MDNESFFEEFFQNMLEEMEHLMTTQTFSTQPNYFMQIEMQAVDKTEQAAEIQYAAEKAKLIKQQDQTEFKKIPWEG